MDNNPFDLASFAYCLGNVNTSAFRYGISVFSMIAVLMVSVVTFAYYYVSPSPTPEILAGLELTQVQINEVSEKSALGGLQSFFTRNLDQINLIWGIGVILFLIRFIFSYAYTKYLKNSAIFSDSSRLKPVLARIQKSLLIEKTIEIAESAKVNVPVVVGHIKPIILFPLGMVNMLSIAEVEAIITHELAHIKRYDYITNILLTLIEILFYFHPAVWWISANVKSERENCCDDFALSHNIDKVVYAKALVKLEEMKSMSIPALAMPFSSKKHQLINRIKRIMNMQQTQSDFKEKSIATILLLSLVVLFSNQANSESTQTNSFEEIKVLPAPTKITGNDEMILKVKDGKLESLTVDNEVQENESVDQVASTFEKNTKDNESYTLTIKESPVLEIVDDKVNIKGHGGVYYESNDNYSPSIKVDTLPQSGSRSSSVITTENGKTIEVERENGEITKLKIDGKLIPKSEYDNYQEELESTENIYEFERDGNFFKHFDRDDFSKSFGLLFDGEQWREFGGNMNQFFDEEVLEKLKEMEGMRFNFDFKNLEDMEGLKGLEKLHELRGLEKLHELEGLEELENLQELFEELGMRMDTAFGDMHFNFDNLDNFDGLDGFKYYYNFDNDDEDNPFFKDYRSDYKSGTVVDKIGKMLNKDGLLKEYKSNKVEITGKHLKINGEKMPKAIFEKYKNIYQETTGAPLTKKSKMVFDVEGKPSKRKVRTF